MSKTMQAFAAIVAGFGGSVVWTPAEAQSIFDAPAQVVGGTVAAGEAVVGGPRRQVVVTGCSRRARHVQQVYYAPATYNSDGFFAFPGEIVGGVIGVGTTVVGGVTQPLFGPFDNDSYRDDGYRTYAYRGYDRGYYRNAGYRDGYNNW